MNFLQPQAKGYCISAFLAKDSGLNPGEETLFSLYLMAQQESL